jgi:SOS-response transcriptional repressor LexA
VDTAVLITHSQGDLYQAITDRLVRYSCRMSDNPIYDRIQARLRKLGISERAASMKAVGNAELLRNIRRNRSVAPRSGSLSKLARVLGVTETWLLTGEGDEEAEQIERGIRYGGIVEASAFRPNDAMNQDAEYRTIPLAPDPRYPASAQFAFEVVGDSMDNADIRPGSWVQVVEIHAWQDVHGEPRDGSFVVVARTRNGDDERELTVKRLRIYRDRIELCPESSNPKHKPFVFPNPPTDNDASEGQVIAVVISSHRLYV